PPTAGAEVVLKYLARYTYRVAMSNGRLVRLSDDDVTFTYKDYRTGGKEAEMTLDVAEFARRFLQHVLPSGFVKVRHYGLLANRYREANLRVCRALLLVVTAAALMATARGDGAGAGGPPPGPGCGGGVWGGVGRGRPRGGGGWRGGAGVPRRRVAEVCRWPRPPVPPPDSS